MNHTFTSHTWGGNKAVNPSLTIALWVSGIILCLTIVLFPLGVMLLSAAIAISIIQTTLICPSCKAKVLVFRNAKAYSCYNCQSVIVKDHNQWRIIQTMRNKILLTIFIVILLIITYVISKPHNDEYNKYMCANYHLKADCKTPLPTEEWLK